MRSQLASTDLGFRSADANYDALSLNLDEQMDDGVTRVRQQQHLGRCEKAYRGSEPFEEVEERGRVKPSCESYCRELF